MTESVRSKDVVEPDLDFDAQARMARITHDYEQNPAVNATFTYNWHGSQELADQASTKIRIYGLMMRDAWPEMNFDALKAITFHHDYELALSEATGTTRKAPVPSKEAGGMSVGMMVRVADGVHLVMHESVALDLASGNDAVRGLARHVVYHELCHVSDFAFKQMLLGKQPERNSYQGLEVSLGPLAEALWDEFYANKYATGNWSNPRTFLDLLRDTVPPIRAELVQAILKYRVSFDLDGLLSLAKSKVRFIAQCFGYAAGTLAALGTSLADEAPDEYAMLSKFGLVDAWEKSFAVLEELDALRPEWESALEIKRLFPACIALFAGFGFQYRAHGEGVYVEIPYTDETTPLQRAQIVRGPSSMSAALTKGSRQ